MKPDPIDATKIAIRALRLLGDGEHAVRDAWQRLTRPAPADPYRSPADRRQPPEVW